MVYANLCQTDSGLAANNRVRGVHKILFLLFQQQSEYLFLQQGLSQSQNAMAVY